MVRYQVKKTKSQQSDIFNYIIIQIRAKVKHSGPSFITNTLDTSRYILFKS